MKIVTRLTLEGKEIELVDQLKKQLKGTRAGVLRKAIALLAEVVDIAGTDGYFSIESPNGEKIKIWTNSKFTKNC